MKQALFYRHTLFVILEISSNISFPSVVYTMRACWIGSRHCKIQDLKRAAAICRFLPAASRLGQRQTSYMRVGCERAR